MLPSMWARGEKSNCCSRKTPRRWPEARMLAAVAAMRDLISASLGAVQPVAVQFAVQGALADAKNVGYRAPVTVVVGQQFRDVLRFHLRQGRKSVLGRVIFSQGRRAPGWPRGRLAAVAGESDVLCADHAVVAQGGCLLQGVAQLPDVSRVMIGRQARQRFVGQAIALAPRLA